jgi:hypothetical protein
MMAVKGNNLRIHCLLEGRPIFGATVVLKGDDTLLLGR